MEEAEDGTTSNKKLHPVEKGVAHCNRLFYKDRLFKNLSIEERKDKRLEEEKPIWTEFWPWIETVTPTGGSKLEKAVNYALNHQKTLMNYLLDERCEITTSRSEKPRPTLPDARISSSMIQWMVHNQRLS